MARDPDVAAAATGGVPCTDVVEAGYDLVMSARDALSDPLASGDVPIRVAAETAPGEDR